MYELEGEPLMTGLLAPVRDKPCFGDLGEPGLLIPFDKAGFFTVGLFGFSLIKVVGFFSTVIALFLESLVTLVSCLNFF